MVPTFAPHWLYVNPPKNNEFDTTPKNTEGILLCNIISWLTQHNPDHGEGFASLDKDIKIEYFSHPEAAFMWEILSEIHDKELPYNFDTIRNLAIDKAVRDFGGIPEGLDGVIGLLVLSWNYSNFRSTDDAVDRFLKEAFTRKVLDIKTSNEPDAFKKGMFYIDQMEVLGDMNRKRSVDHHSMPEMALSHNDIMEGRITDPDRNKGLTWNYKTLDEHIPIFKENLIIIGGRTGSGKSTLTYNLIRKMLLADKKIAMFTMEITHSNIFEILVGQTARLSNKVFKNPGIMSDHEIDLHHAAVAQLYKQNLEVVDRSAISLEDIARQTSHMKRRLGNLDAIFIDNINLMGAGNNKFNSLREKFIHISGGLKNLAKDMKIPVFLLVQLNRAATARVDKTPLVSDIKESGSIEQDADTIVLTFKDDEVDEGDRKGSYIVCRKNRNGQRVDFKVPTIVDPTTGILEEG